MFCSAQTAGPSDKSSYFFMTPLARLLGLLIIAAVSSATGMTRTPFPMSTHRQCWPTTEGTEVVRQFRTHLNHPENGPVPALIKCTLLYRQSGVCDAHVGEFILGRVLFEANWEDGPMMPYDTPGYVHVQSIFARMQPRMFAGVKYVGQRLMTAVFGIAQDCGFGGRVSLVSSQEALGFYERLRMRPVRNSQCAMHLDADGQAFCQDLLTRDLVYDN
jgi:hypothetical protein